MMPGIRGDVRHLTVLGMWFVMLMVLATSVSANPRYASIVVDAASGEVLHGENADATRYPASLTKMMTLYLLFEAIEEGRIALDQPMPVSSYAASKPASKLWLRAGSTITPREAIPALIIRSANDVAVVVAEALGGTEQGFARMMNDKARTMGMMSTHFNNPSGLPDPSQVSTARDLATLSMRLMNDFPQHYHRFSETRFTYRGTTHNGHNRLLTNYAGADGLKTGYIRASGFNVATSAIRNGRRIVAVVMGGFTAQSRDAHMVDLLDRGFVRASLLNNSDWVAKADISGNVERIHAMPPAPVAEYDRIADFAKQMPVPDTTPTVTTMTASLAPADTSSVESDVMSDAMPSSAEDPILALMNGFGQEEMGGDWSVQIGAFHDASQAQVFATRAADYLEQNQLPTRVAITESPERQVYRARLVDLEETQARTACDRLQQQGMDCLVVR
ncbi:D-alanyl-D-alanine carboxypeptidase [Litchfieldella xinjiangensis]|uniref:D-alanyl-D-alanine carboxypeptidase n=1 Tax=Litchfieldella xinjiangensis TaxID=1166948 RepID=UPI002F357AC0